MSKSRIYRHITDIGEGKIIERFDEDEDYVNSLNTSQ